MPFNIKNQKGKNIYNIENVNIESTKDNKMEERENNSPPLDNLRDLIKENKIQKAITVLEQYFESNTIDKELKNELTLFSANHHAINKKEIHSLETAENIRLEKSKLIWGLLNLIDRIKMPNHNK